MDGPAPGIIPPDVVLSRIEVFILTWLETLVNPDIAELPTFEVARLARAAGELDGDDELPPLNEYPVIKSLSRTCARSYMGIFLVLEFCHKLLSSNRTATLREVYYCFKGNGPCTFKNQAEADEAVLSTASLLGVARHELGIFASAKGYLAGPIHYRHGQDDEPWNDCRDGCLIRSIWITHGRQLQIQSEARYLLVVEKEGIYQRLLDDGITRQLGGIILITGKGFPDVATRACVHAISSALPNIRVLGLCDCNPFGAALLLTYKLGSLRMGADVQAFAVPRLRWIGLRPSQVQRLGIPPDAMQRHSKADTSRLNGLLRSQFIRDDAAWQQEILAMQTAKVKCELEALYYRRALEGRGYGALNALGIDYISTTFVIESILRRDVV